MNEAQQTKIDYINELVRQYKEEDNKEAREILVEDVFKPFILSQCEKWNKLYPGVHNFEAIKQEARCLFINLLDEYTIGGTAYFNVFIERKFPLRLRYFFVKEIKHRGRNLCHDEQQILAKYDGFAESDDITDLIDNEDINDKKNMIMGLVNSDLLNDRERDMLMQNMSGKSHQTIADEYGISRSRVTKIISNALKKIKTEVSDYYKFNGWEME